MKSNVVFVSPVCRAIPFDNAKNKLSSINAQTAIEEIQLFALLGSGADGSPTYNSGTITLTRSMYYENLTLTGSAVLKPNGFKIFVRNTLSISGDAAIDHSGSEGLSAVGSTPGVAGTGLNGFELGTSQSGTNGAAVSSSSTAPPTQSGYGGSGGKGGNSGANAGASGGNVTYYPEQTVSLFHFSGPGGFKSGGGGGAGGAGGNQPLLTVAGAGGGGGSGGGVIFIICGKFSNTSSKGITAKGGNGGNGGIAGSGNAAGGGGGGGGGGGFIYLLTVEIINLGVLSVSGGLGGNGGIGAGSGVAGLSGASGSPGHTSVYQARTGTWLVS